MGESSRQMPQLLRILHSLFHLSMDFYFLTSHFALFFLHEILPPVAFYHFSITIFGFIIFILRQYSTNNIQEIVFLKKKLFRAVTSTVKYLWKDRRLLKAYQEYKNLSRIKFSQCEYAYKPRFNGIIKYLKRI